MRSVMEQIAELKLIPMVVMDKADHAGPFADALVAGGLPVAEITFRTAAAEAAIRTLAKRGDLLVGAGTVLSIEQADRAIDAGAQFLVAPGTNPKVVEHVLMRGVPMVPGIATPTDIELATSLGATMLKFFPAEQMGGADTLKAFAGPYPDVRFIPTGGITPELLPRYLKLPSVVACGGSWLAPRDLLAAGKFDAIKTLDRTSGKATCRPTCRGEVGWHAQSSRRWAWSVLQFSHALRRRLMDVPPEHCYIAGRANSRPISCPPPHVPPLATRVTKMELPGHRVAVGSHVPDRGRRRAAADSRVRRQKIGRCRFRAWTARAAAGTPSSAGRAAAATRRPSGWPGPASTASRRREL